MVTRRAMGLVLHELATNATKHGALSLPEGQVRLSWETRDLEGGVRVLELTWVERGGPPVNKSRKAGVGSRLIDHAVANARVTRDFRPERSGLLHDRAAHDRPRPHHCRLTASAPAGNHVRYCDRGPARAISCRPTKRSSGAGAHPTRSCLW